MKKFIYLALIPAIVSSLIHGAAAPEAEQHLLTREHMAALQHLSNIERKALAVSCYGGKIQSVQVSNDRQIVTFTLAYWQYKNSFWERAACCVGAPPEISEVDSPCSYYLRLCCCCLCLFKHKGEWKNIQVKYRTDDITRFGFYIDCTAHLNRKELCDTIGSNGDLAKVNELLKQGISSDSRDENGNTALIVAIQHGRMDVVDALLTHNVNVNAENPDGKTALTIARETRNEELAHKLFLHGARMPEAEPGTE